MNLTATAIIFAGIMILVGTLVRAKVKLFQNILMPATVIGGIIGLILLNLVEDRITLVSSKSYVDMVNVFFTLSFIAVGLGETEVKKNGSAEVTEGNQRRKKKNFSGALYMACVTFVNYSILAVVGWMICFLVGKPFGVDAFYGMMLSNGFIQGPGLASTFGKIYENTCGYANAEMISITFAVIGFLVAFLVGAPLAKYGIKRKLVNNNREIDEIVSRGYYKRGEIKPSLGHVTTDGGNVGTLSIHAAIIGIIYIFAMGIADLAAQIPVTGSMVADMPFFWGLFVAKIFKMVLKKMKCDFLLSEKLLRELASFFTDFTVMSAFLCIEFKVIGAYIIPILAVGVACTVAVLVVSMYFCFRMGSDHDFERFLGVYGSCTGTIPSGISLIRIIDPSLSTMATLELGLTSVAAIILCPIFFGNLVLTVLVGMGTISILPAILGFALLGAICLIVLKLSGGWKREKSIPGLFRKE